MKDKNNWFRNNPKKTLVVFFLLIMLILIFSAEMILSLKYKNQNFGGIQRFIRLKEHRPFLSLSGLRIDRKGFIVPSEIHNDSDMNIVFLGGSTTECRVVSEKARFPYLVGRIIEKQTGLKVNSYNSGVSGNTSIHSIDILLNKIIPLTPRMVVMMHNVNDLSTLLLEGSYWDNSPTRSLIVRINPIKDFLLKLKNIFIPNLYYTWKEFSNFIKQRFGKKPVGEFDHVKGQKKINQTYLISEFRKNLKLFISICRIRGITPVLMTQANRLKDNPDDLIIELTKPLQEDYQLAYKDYKEIYDLFNQAIRDVGEEHNVLVIDLARHVPQAKEYIYDIAHYNDNGSEFIAEIISKELLSILKNKT